MQSGYKTKKGCNPNTDSKEERAKKAKCASAIAAFGQTEVGRRRDEDLPYFLTSDPNPQGKPSAYRYGAGHAQGHDLAPAPIRIWTKRSRWSEKLIVQSTSYPMDVKKE